MKVIEQDQPFALHITWTCYGTWLPGDPRGHVSNSLLPDGSFLPKRNIPGTAYSEGDARTHQRAQALQKYPTVLLAASQALCVVKSLLEAANARDWRILRAAVMSNHTHVVIADCPDDGSAVRRILKGVTQAALSRADGRPTKWWTKGGSDRYKHGHEAIEAAIRYVARQAGVLAAIDDMRIVLPRAYGE